MLRHLLIALLLAALVIPGCRLKPRATMPTLPPADAIAIEDTAMHSIHITMLTGPTGKPARDAVTVRLSWRDQVIATETVGRGHRWAPGSTESVIFPLSPPIRMDRPGNLLLEIVKSDATADRPPWTVHVEALGRLTDGTVMELLPRTEATAIGGGRPGAAAWLLRAR